MFGQSPTANLVGRVQDQTGGVVPAASILVRHAAVGETREVKSDENGEYTITNLPPGNYRITVEKDGFRRLVERGLTLEVDQTARLDFELQIGAVSETVQVTASVPLLNTENAMRGDVIVSREMTDIPLDGPRLRRSGLPGAGRGPEGAGCQRLQFCREWRAQR